MILSGKCNQLHIDIHLNLMYIISMNTTHQPTESEIEQAQNIKILFPEFFNSMIELATISIQG